MNADLLRQRRNLIVVSSVLLIFDFSQVTITKVSVLDTELLIGNAQVLMACAWILWAYFYLRYYQYWRAEPESHVRGAFSKRLDGYVRSYTKAKPIQDSSYGQVAACLDALSPRPTFVIGVACPLEVLEKRESRREDRGNGMAREQFGHPAYQRAYSMKVDTSVLSPEEAARAIREFVSRKRG